MSFCLQYLWNKNGEGYLLSCQQFSFERWSDKPIKKIIILSFCMPIIPLIFNQHSSCLETLVNTLQKCLWSFKFISFLIQNSEFQTDWWVSLDIFISILELFLHMWPCWQPPTFVFRWGLKYSWIYVILFTAKNCHGVDFIHNLL